MDFVGNIACPNIDFATMHVCERPCLLHHLHCTADMPMPCSLLGIPAAGCSRSHTQHPKIVECQVVRGFCPAAPDNWAIQSYEFDWVNANFIRDRASIAHAQNKPFIIEETGMQVRNPFGSA